MVEKCRSSEVTFDFQAILHPKWGRLPCFHPMLMFESSIIIDHVNIVCGSGMYFIYR